MPALLVRMILSISLIIVAVLVFLFALVLCNHRAIGISNDTAFGVASVATVLFFTAGWIGVWAGAVKWNASRSAWTGLAMVISLFIGALAGIAAALVFRPGSVTEEIGCLVGTITWGVAWLACSAIAWRESAAERAQRLRHMGIKTIACPNCGYNLTGLRETRCPECGAQFTVDQLLADVLEQRAPVEMREARDV